MTTTATNFEVQSKLSKNGKRTVYYPTINGQRINSINFGKKWEASKLAKDYLQAFVYEGSPCYKNIEYTNDPEQLKNIKRTLESVLNYDINEANKDFFKKALEHVNKKFTQSV